MEFKTSPKGIPYIEFDEDSRMIFTKTCPADKGFKWISINTYQTVYVGKARKEVNERCNFIVDLALGMPKGFHSVSLTKKKLKFLRKLIKDNINGTGTLPETTLPEIADAINNWQERKTRSDKGKPRKVVKKIKPKKLKEEKTTKQVEVGKTCKSCQKELFSVPSCNSLMLVGHGERWVPVVHKGKAPCESCGVMPGGRHHLYCPVEECPRCGKKMVKCGCF